MAIFRFFKDGDRPPCWILTSAIFKVRYSLKYHARHLIKFGRNRLQKYHHLTAFQNGSRRRLGFLKVNFLTADTLEKPNLRNPAKFHQDRSIR